MGWALAAGILVAAAGRLCLAPGPSASASEAEPAPPATDAAQAESVDERVAETRAAYEERIRELEERVRALEQGRSATGDATGDPASGARPEGDDPSPGEDPKLDAILGEVGGSDDAGVDTDRSSTPPPAASATGPDPSGIDAITREAGETQARQMPWFPSINNPQLGVMIETLARFPTGRGHDNQLEMREAEVNIFGNVDPFGQAFALLSGSNEVSIEEAYFLFTGLPWDLQLRAGKFFSQSSRLNKTHTHDLPFVDQPLAMQNAVGTYEPVDAGSPVLPLGIGPQHVGTGAELYWLVPTDFYWKLQANVYQDFSDRTDGSFWQQYLQGTSPDAPPYEYRNRNPGDFAYGAGSRMFFELAEDHGLNLGANFIYDAPNGSTQRLHENVHVAYNWLPLEGGLYQGLRWTTELFANQERFLPGATGISDQDTWGVYSYVNTKLGLRLSAGLLGEWTQLRYDRGSEAWHAGSWLSYHLSERQRIRFQVDWFDVQEWLDTVGGRLGEAPGDGDFWQFTLQWVLTLGAHTHTYD